MADFQDNFFLLLVGLASMFLIRTIISKTRNKPRLPPSPRALPIIGHLHLLTKIPHQALHKLSNRYGPLIYLLFGSKPCVIVSSPEIAKECLKTNEKCFLNRPKMANIDYLTYGSADFTMAPYGPYWKFMKKLCMSELLGVRTLDLHIPVRREEIKRFLKSTLRKAEKGEEMEVGAEVIRLTNNIISRMALKRRCSEDEDEAHKVRKLIEEMCELAGRFNASDMFWFCKNLDLQGYGKRLKDVRDGEAIEDCNINGYHIPAKTQIFVNVWALGRDPNHWENPLEFLPERFTGKKRQLDVRGQHFEYLPFGSGRRSCPGASLAMKVVQTTLGAMIQCFDWKAGEDANGKVDMEEGPGISLPRAHPLVCVPVSRLSSSAFT
ncbi:hypothetical protein FEM48_ZijujUnG0057500 [Ziziphus jujuba var. spinosa]|uniref:3,9-dihydroxypterocarpan 6A-monooxygenase-like n=1 Tax=Ziziphus jujuba var. spinosa TaxID=714518 RepID=A0A978U916_ZIZJJ|nr:hypothetical protein FEM48_ZijujUnG0057500 [Ziziphus jujuba var. spinosa]